MVGPRIWIGQGVVDEQGPQCLIAAHETRFVGDGERLGGDVANVVEIERVGGWIEGEQREELVAVVVPKGGDERGEGTLGSFLVVRCRWYLGWWHGCHFRVFHINAAVCFC